MATSFPVDFLNLVIIISTVLGASNKSSGRLRVHARYERAWVTLSICFVSTRTSLGKVLSEELGQIDVDLSVDLSYRRKYLINHWHPLIFTWYSVKSNATFDDTVSQLDLLGSTSKLWDDKVNVPMTLALNLERIRYLSKTSNDPLNLITVLVPSSGLLTLTSLKSETFTYPHIDFLANQWDLVATLRAFRDTDIFLNAASPTLTPDVIQKFW
ncbi:hypothetical protein K435DRAFT_797308 [Dendrothele bispora CBS 962.96]|uniref:Uncharacterized protein n=1 Tax=Dendrothele bispora (strain CBS 962.96) TaxID=1314807 RepID=A0A4S8M2Y2_DENBC|nr:hypothetical protein K435DRAFT_797308 [Dendrothele bispora CBS 962.96]